MKFPSEHIVWNAHGCFPLQSDTDLSGLQIYQQAGIDFVAINVGVDFTPSSDVAQLLVHFRRWIRQHHQHYSLVHSITDLENAKKQGKLGVAFDLEGVGPLNGKSGMLELFYELGVRQILLAYNRNNAAAGGCIDNDLGLTPYGRDLVKGMNRLGILVDASHTSERATLEMMELSQTPVIFSHSNCRALCAHPRNITDAQIKACAQQKGVIGINGLSIFLGEGADLPQLFARHILYIAELVGIDYIGIGLDYEESPSKDLLNQNKQYFYIPPGESLQMPVFMKPSQLSRVIELLQKQGFHRQDLDKIFGGNFLRVAREAWGSV